MALGYLDLKLKLLRLIDAAQRRFSERTLSDAEHRRLLHLYVISIDEVRITGTCDCLSAKRLLLSGWKFALSRFDEPGSARVILERTLFCAV